MSRLPIKVHLECTVYPNQLYIIEVLIPFFFILFTLIHRSVTFSVI